MTNQNDNLLVIAKSIGSDWIESPYYEDAEKWLHTFWDENSQFKRLFDQEDIIIDIDLTMADTEKITPLDVSQVWADKLQARFKL